MTERIDVKICGLTNRDDAIAAIDLGADYVGFVLYAQSPRRIGSARLARLLDKIDAPRKAIGVFVNESRANVENIACDCGLFAVQLHGDEDADEFSGMNLPVWRALRFVEGVCTPSPRAWQAARYVVDAARAGKYGGTGAVADWDKTAAFAAKYPVMLAGGLTPENVGKAVRKVRPLGVDVASGVESRPGLKDAGKMARFILAARKAFASNERKEDIKDR